MAKLSDRRLRGLVRASDPDTDDFDALDELLGPDIAQNELAAIAKELLAARKVVRAAKAYVKARNSVWDFSAVAEDLTGALDAYDKREGNSKARGKKGGR